MTKPPSTSSEKPTSASRRPVRRFWSDRADVRSVQIGVVATIALHLLLLASAPKLERWLGLHANSDNSTRDPWAARELQIEFTSGNESFPMPVPDPPLAEPEPVAPLKFVEANPNAPDNVPDKTDNVAALNQQVAQESPTPNGKNDAPTVKGDPTRDTTAIVSGELAEPVVRRSTAPENRAETSTQEAARRLQETLPGEERFEGESPDGVGSNVGKSSTNAAAVPERVEGVADAKNTTGPKSGLYYQVDAKRPRPRPTLAPEVVKARSSPVANRELGTENIGVVAYDAKWSAYGEYLQKFFETVEVQWKRILDQTNVWPTAGTKVTVRFRMDSKGDVPRIIDVKSNGNRSFESACVSAIVARAPYGPWTEDMLRVLGDSQEFTFSFEIR